MTDSVNPDRQCRKQDRRNDGYEELHDAQNERYRTGRVGRIKETNVKRRSGRKHKRNEEEQQAPRQMRCIIPSRRDIRELR